MCRPCENTNSKSNTEYKTNSAPIVAKTKNLQKKELLLRKKKDKIRLKKCTRNSYLKRVRENLRKTEGGMVTNNNNINNLDMCPSRITPVMI